MPLSVLTLVITAALPLAVALARNAPPRTLVSEDRAKAVELANSIEFDPLGPDAKDQRTWISRWVADVSDPHIRACPNLLGPLADSKKNNAPEIVGQMLPAAAAFVVAHPDKAADPIAVYTAGVEGALRAYENILRAKPKSANPFLDELIRKQKLSELRAYVEGLAGRCQ